MKFMFLYKWSTYRCLELLGNSARLSYGLDGGKRWYFPGQKTAGFPDKKLIITRLKLRAESRKYVLLLRTTSRLSMKIVEFSHLMEISNVKTLFSKEYILSQHNWNKYRFALIPLCMCSFEEFCGYIINLMVWFLGV